MVMSAKQRQKKIEQKNKKKALAKKALREFVHSKGQASAYAQYPIYECVVPDGLFDTGLASLFIARQAPNGLLGVSSLILDVYCLGVKDAFFRVMSEHEYEHKLKAGMIARHKGQEFEKMHVACVKKLVDGAIEYAARLGFSPHPDYRKAEGIFDGIDAEACPVHYEYGNDGKPFYIRGPNESIKRARQIVEQLAKTCGEGNFDYIIPMDELPPIPG
uniref:Uncharacterized protein n=1 Tax=Candidatus Kentrum sp. FM TaxID=2126340 RepID=A0A450WCA1_9GAMM|nr:MAG: hypothetical protein BECKFM1743C_GA0114222_103243 [Candidatus Kentron sp. FM]VFJ63147.1 MAG: hypothetical protein BECKFM1743A_GA0114220_103253 [Candidatus Kentron sp. FM]VFK14581.1 MAG: hypothetical protein BECKFM1743B_GA0114221_103283 [Candidatus Kentron sp. FM]